VILADTSVWVSHLRHGEARLKDLLNENQVLVHPFVIGELACGNPKNRKETLSLLHALPAAPAVEQAELLRFVEQRHLPGSGIGFVDAHLLASTQLAGALLWTSDRLLRQAAQKLNLNYTP